MRSRILVVCRVDPRRDASGPAHKASSRSRTKRSGSMPRVGAPVPSPDGKWVVVSVTQPAYDDKDQTADLWLVPADGSAAPRRLTSTKATESGVAWSADSRRIAFATRREGDDVNQIYSLDLANGGEATRVTSLSTGAASRRGVPTARRSSSRASSTPTPPTTRPTRRSPPSARIRSTRSGPTTAFPFDTGIAGSTIIRSTCSCRISIRRARRRICWPARNSSGIPASADAGSTRARNWTPSGRPTAARSCLPRRPIAPQRRSRPSTSISIRCRPPAASRRSSLAAGSRTNIPDFVRTGVRSTSRRAPTTSRCMRSIVSPWLRGPLTERSAIRSFCRKDSIAPSRAGRFQRTARRST